MGTRNIYNWKTTTKKERSISHKSLKKLNIIWKYLYCLQCTIVPRKQTQRNIATLSSTNKNKSTGNDTDFVINMFYPKMKINVKVEGNKFENLKIFFKHTHIHSHKI